MRAKLPLQYLRTPKDLGGETRPIPDLEWKSREVYLEAEVKKMNNCIGLLEWFLTFLFKNFFQKKIDSPKTNFSDFDEGCPKNHPIGG